MTTIALTGVHNSGKTTMIHQLARMYHTVCKTTHVVAEAARECPYKECTVRRQKWIWYKHWEREMEARSGVADIILIDRTVMDNIVYLRYTLDDVGTPHDEETYNFFYAVAREHMKNYDHIIRMPMNLAYMGENDDMDTAIVIDEMFDDLVGQYVNSILDDLSFIA